LRLTVEDRGVGLPPEQVRRGIGLISMRERAGLVGGTIDFSRPSGGGVCVTLQVPLRASAADPGSSAEPGGSAAQ
jgi:signal transduction histidine kinase